jgi:hypothetical protein
MNYGESITQIAVTHVAEVPHSRLHQNLSKDLKV